MNSLSAKQYSVLQNLVKYADNQADWDLQYAAYIVKLILQREKHKQDIDYHYQFFRMTSEDWRNLRIKYFYSETVTDYSALQEELNQEFTPVYRDIENAIESEQATLLQDREDTEYVACIVDETLTIVARLWMKEGQIWIENQLNSTFSLTKGYHYDEIAL